MPKIVDSEERRALIVDAVWATIDAEGLEAATLRRVAETAGYTTGLVTHYFKSRDEMLEAAIKLMGERAEKRLDGLRGGTGVAGLREFILASLPVTPELASEWRIWYALWHEAASNDGHAQNWWRRSESWTREVKATVERLVVTGDLPSEVPADVQAEGITALVYGLSVAGSLRPPRLNNEQMIAVADHYLDLLTGAGKAAPAPNKATRPRKATR